MAESGVIVATTKRSISPGFEPASSRAAKAALAAMSDEASSAAAIRRLLMPVRVLIHSSFVSTVFARSSLVRTLSGTQPPTPVITALFCEIEFAI